MKVLQINTVSGISSTGRIASDIAELLIASGNDCRIAYGIEPCNANYKAISYRIGSKLSVKLHSAISQAFDAEGLGSICATKRLIHYISAYKPDIIHLHNIHGCFIHYPSLFNYLRKAQTPTLWTLHDCWAFTGHCAYFDYISCNKWHTECSNCPQSRTGYPRNILFDMSRRNYNYKKRATKGLNMQIVTPSKWLKGLVAGSFLKGYTCHVVYNGIDEQRFFAENVHDDRYCFNNKRVLLAVAADWDRRKGIDDILYMAQKLPDSHIIVAIGNNAPIHKNIIAMNRTESVDDLRKLYCRADCLINPTYEDNFPMVNIESLACATPVAVYNTGGCPEIIDDTVGCVVNKGDKDSLLMNALAISEHKNDFSEKCIARAGSFKKAECYDGYIRLYKEMCK